MKFAIITTKYPKKNDYYRNGFVHQRNLKYKEFGYECKVFIINNDEIENNYVYEGISVCEGNYNYIKESIIDWIPDKILIHFIEKSHMRLLDELGYSIPTYIWIHGVEALKWTRRLFNFNGLKFLRYIKENTIRMQNMKKFIRKSRNIKFIFVSKWMKDVMEKDVGVKVNQYKIIPNVINTDLFKFQKKDPNQRKKILLIRNFDSKKYANDIAIKAILELKEKDFFDELEICIYGQGKYFKQLTSKLDNINNVKINNRFLSQIEISEIHKEYGVFLCPTRQDSQGVSMCEAMSSGLVPVTSNNTAIPEFVTEEAGYLTDNSPGEIVKAIEDLYFNEKDFLKKSFNCNRLINTKCNELIVIKDEISYLLWSNHQRLEFKNES
jgi:L-malate glycosyltransferase